MDRNAETIFRKLFDAGSKAFKLIREEAISPELTKKLKEYGIAEAATMSGRTSQTLRNLEDTGKIPKARQVQRGKRTERVYSLAEVNHLRDLLGTRLKKPQGAQTAILGFVNFKGGAGKTTSAIGAAQYLAEKGYKVLFIDCDSQGSATQMFGHIPDEDFEEKDTILNILTDESQNIKGVIKKTYWPGLDLIPANLSLYQAEFIIPTQIATSSNKTTESLQFYNRLNKSLKTLGDDYDIVVLDCPPSMGMISINAIYAANALLIPMPPVIVDYASTIQFFKMVSEVMERLPKKSYAFIRILITKFNNRTVAKQLQDLLRGFFGQYIMTNNMIESEAISKAAANMQTLHEIDKFDSDKRTYERALRHSNNVNEELESLIQVMWEQSISTSGKTTIMNTRILEEEIVK